MTYPERVNRYNIGKLRQCILNGPDTHPGANLIRSENGARTFALQYANRERLAAALSVGDIVERHMEDGDIVLFNRQPSLHKMCVMCSCYDSIYHGLPCRMCSAWQVAHVARGQDLHVAHLPLQRVLLHALQRRCLPYPTALLLQFVSHVCVILYVCTQTSTGTR